MKELRDRCLVAPALAAQASLPVTWTSRLMCNGKDQKRIVALDENEIVWEPLERNLVNPELLGKPGIRRRGDRRLPQETYRNT